MTPAIIDVLAERKRQIEVEGWTKDHDSDHDAGMLCAAGAAYAINASDVLNPLSQGDGQGEPVIWPWGMDWWKPTTPRRDLVKAAALIIAEIEKLDREQPPSLTERHKQ